MNEAQKVYLEIYSAAVRGWLGNQYASYTDCAQTAETAHLIADRVAKLGSIAIANIGKEEACSPS